MKKIIILLVLILVLGLGFLGCKFTNMDAVLYNVEFDYSEEFNNSTEIRLWVHNNIKYQRDSVVFNDNEYDYYDYWQPPYETYSKRTGDCEDKELLFMYFLKEIGIKSNLLIIITDNNRQHSIVKIEGDLYPYQSATWNSIMKTCNYEIIAEYTYEEAMWYAKKWNNDNFYLRY